MSEPQIDINSSIHEMLSLKLKFHEEQIAKHRKQKEETKRALAKLTSVPEMAGAAPGTVYHVSHVDGIQTISQKTVKPLVIEIMKDGASYTTQKLFDVLKETHRIGEADRKDWISAISSSLNSLATYNKATAIETGIGRTKAYTLKEEVISAERHASAVAAFKDVDFEEDENNHGL